MPTRKGRIMASEWKYSAVPASERLYMVKNGDADVYQSEIARSVSTANSRRELGLDISEQKAWIDSLSYNYNLYSAEKMGISPSLVSKTGYADKLLEESAGKSGRRYITTVSKRTNLEHRAKELLTEYYGKVSAFAEKKKNVEEWLMNNGIDQNSETGRKYIEEFEESLKNAAEKYGKEYASKLRSAAEKYER